MSAEGRTDDGAGLLDSHIRLWTVGPFATRLTAPWHVVGTGPTLIEAVLPDLGGDYRIERSVAVHRSAEVEPGAIIKGPAILGPRCFVAASAYLRGGVYLGETCIVGPGCELKTTVMFPGSKVAHLSFVGDSVIGSDCNIEAGAVVANFRNERSDTRIRIAWNGHILDTGQDKFGALIGDGCRIGANAVIAPGAILAPGTIVPRLGLVDQSPQ